MLEVVSSPPVRYLTIHEYLRFDTIFFVKLIMYLHTINKQYKLITFLDKRKNLRLYNDIL